MKKKVEPKPTKVSRHVSPYVFQQKSINLHPLSGKHAHKVTQYQPNTYIMGHTSVMSLESTPAAPLQSQTYSLAQSASSGYFNNTVSENDSYYSSDAFDGDCGLSTDGLEVYESGNGATLAPAPEAKLEARQAVNANRGKLVKSAPAAFPGDGRRMSIADFAEAVQANKPSEMLKLEHDSDLQWLMTSSLAAAEEKPAQRARSAAGTRGKVMRLMLL